MDKINIRLKQLRQEKTLFQRDIAEKLNIEVNTYGAWERGSCEPSSDMLYKLSKLYGVTIEYLLGHENDDYTSTINNTILPPDEERLLQEYRKLDKSMKKMCYYYVEHMVTATKEATENKKHC